MFINLYFGQQANVCVSIIRVGESKEGKRERKKDRRRKRRRRRRRKKKRKTERILRLKIAAYMV